MRFYNAFETFNDTFTVFSIINGRYAVSLFTSSFCTSKTCTDNSREHVCIYYTYIFFNCDIFIPFCKSLIRSHFDYAMNIWSPNLCKFIDSIESVQRRATKIIPEIKNVSYPERLKYLNLPTLAYRRARGDMIEVFKIISNIYNSKSTEQLLSMREKYIFYYEDTNSHLSIIDCILQQGKHILETDVPTHGILYQAILLVLPL